MKEPKKHILFIANTDWSFYHFWLPHLLKFEAQPEYKLTLVCPDGENLQKLLSYGFKHIPYVLNRKGMNPLSEWSTVSQLMNIIKAENPDIIHTITTKPAFYASFALLILSMRFKRFKKVPIVNSFMGLGVLFSSQNSILQKVMKPFLKLIFNRPQVHHSFSNGNDLAVFKASKLVYGENGFVLLSESINTEEFKPLEIRRNEDRLIALMAVRILWSKGVQEFIDAAKRFKNEGKKINFWIAGLPDPGNPDAVPAEQLKEWHDQGIINWLGHIDDIADLMRKVDIVVLPSYYNEGAPRILIEALATELPVIATDIPGCKVIVRENENGLFIKPRSSEEIYRALSYLMENPSERERMGKNGRKQAVEEYGNEKISQLWIDLYKSKFK